MTTRELLRAVADAADLRALEMDARGREGNDAGKVLYAARRAIWQQRAAALRALATRFDEEEAGLVSMDDPGGYVRNLLARLDAPLP